MANVSPAHRQILGEPDLVVGMDPSNSRLLKYDESDGGRKQAFASLDARLFGERDVVQVWIPPMHRKLPCCFGKLSLFAQTLCRAGWRQISIATCLKNVVMALPLHLLVDVEHC